MRRARPQALERSQPILPLRPGLPERQTHDHVRHGTLSLFAAYDAATGRVLGRCHQRHRHQEFLAFLERIDAAFPDDGQSQLHLIIDNYSTHKTSKVRRWLLRHPRFHLHFTPTGSSWLNMVERFFARLTTETIRRETSLRCDNFKPPLMRTSPSTIKNPNLLLGLTLQIPSSETLKTPFLKLTSLS